MVIGSEGRAFANAGRASLDFWTPNINPFKDPRWGRGLETPGEDPRRIAGYVKHLLMGMEWANQDANLVEDRLVIATCKHFTAYDLERWNGITRYKFDAIVSMQDLVEYYLPPFKQCARDSNVGSIMCSYNSINGTPACANEYLMQTVLREHWNWTKHNNYIVSDCNAIHNIYKDHAWVGSEAEAAGKAFNAGMDLICEADSKKADVIGAYNQSLLSEAVIDRSLQRQYEGLVRAEYFQSYHNDVSGFRAYDASYVNKPFSNTLARTSASDGMVLLKNDGTLPISFNHNQTIAIIGHWANDTTYRMLGNYNGKPPSYHTPLYAARELDLKVNYANGPLSKPENYSTALSAAKASDIVLYFGGIDTSIESEDLDRTTIAWSAIQLALLAELSAMNKTIIVVQLGTQIDNTSLLQNKNINSILWTGYPGMHGGTAVFDLLSGAKAPAGRLPITQYPTNYTQQVPMTDMSLRPNGSNPGRTYKWYAGAVQEFGFGLHYTNFSAAISPPYTARKGQGKRNAAVFQMADLLDGCMERYLDLCPLPDLPVVVKNTGRVMSDYVVLVFVSTTAGPKPHPRKELASYKRLRDVGAGEERRVGLGLRVGDLARVDGRGNTVLYGGVYCLGVDVDGVLGVRERVESCFEIEGGDRVVDVWPQPGGNRSSVG